MADPTKPGEKKITVTKVVNGVDTQVEVEVDDTAGPEWGANDKHRLLNKPMVRVDGAVKASGTAKYTYDMRAAGMLYGRILRSPHARAHVKSLDSSEATKIKGVAGVIEVNREALYEGMPIAAVAAATPEIAEDALRTLKVEYEILPHVVTRDAALKPGAAQVYPGDRKVHANVRLAEKRGDAAKVDAAIKGADVSADAVYTTPRIHHCCLETHGLMVDYRGGNSATVYASTQGTFTIPPESSQVLGLKQSAVTSVVQHMGGGFGSKFGIGIEGRLACELSKKFKVPVHLMLTRTDEFLTAGNREGTWQRVRAGANKDGSLIAMDALQQKMGGLAGGSLAGLPYQYHVPEMFRQIESVHTNEDASRAMRAPGHPEASYAMESMMDELADKLGMDPLEFRVKNLRDDVHERQLARAAKEIGWHKRNKTAGAGMAR